MNLTILKEYDNMIEKKSQLILNTNASVLIVSGVFSVFISTNLLFLTLLSGINMLYIIKKVIQKRNNNNLNKEDIKFLHSLAFIYNVDYKKLTKHLNKNLLLKENIFKAYKKRAKDLHPDVLGGNKKKFQELVYHKGIVEMYFKNFNKRNVNRK